MKNLKYLLLLIFMFSNIYSKPILLVYGPATKGNVYSRKAIKSYIQTLDGVSEDFRVFPSYNDKILSKKSIRKFYKQNDDFYFELESMILSLYGKSLEKVTIVVVGEAIHFVKNTMKYFEAEGKKYIGSLILVNAENEQKSILGLDRDIKRVQIDEFGKISLVKDTTSFDNTRLELLDIEDGDIADDELDTEKESIVILNSDDVDNIEDSVEEQSCCSIWCTPKRVDSVIKLSTVLLEVVALLAG